MKEEPRELDVVMHLCKKKILHCCFPVTVTVTYKPKGGTLQPCMGGLTSDLQFQSHFGPPPVPISRDPSRAWGWETEGGQVTSGRCRVNHSLLWRASTTASCGAWGRQHSSSGSPSWLSTVAASLWRPCGEEGREPWGASLMVHGIIPCIGHPPFAPANLSEHQNI